MTRSDLEVITRGLAPLFQAIATRLSALEVKERGLDGATGPRGLEGSPGRDGRDGVSVAGPPGEKGADGLGFDDLDLVVDEARKTWVFRASRGDVVKEWVLPLPLDEGTYSDSETYRKGNSVTKGGAVYIAKLDQVKGIEPGNGTPESATAWRLIVARGKEGKQGREGKQGLPGKDLRWEDRDA